MISFGSKKSKSTTQASSQTDPWDETIPQLRDFLATLDAESENLGVTPAQKEAFASLKAKAQQGHPAADQISTLASEQFGTTSRAPMVDAAYQRLQNELGGYARGDNLDFETNPFIQKMLAQAGDDVQNRIAGVFAGRGRDVSGNAAGQGAIAKGVTAAQLPILSELYAREQQNQIGAANALYGAGANTATTGQALDKDAQGSRVAGIETANAAMQARDWGDNAVLNLEQQEKELPFTDQALRASLLLPTAGLGSQQTGTSTTTGKSSSMGLDLSLKNIGALGSAAMALSDERAKENVEEVGKTHDGQKLYRFNYKGDPLVHIGLIAQEVEDDNPEAVEEIDGMKHVDIRKATNASAKMKKRA